MWDIAGLQGPALHLVEGDRDAANWLGKLEVVKTLLVDKGGGGEGADVARGLDRGVWLVLEASWLGKLEVVNSLLVGHSGPAWFGGHGTHTHTHTGC